MADYGTVGTEYRAFRVLRWRPLAWRILRVNGEPWIRGGIDTSEGDPAQPSIRFDAQGVWRFRWAFAAGSRTISVRVKQVANLSPRPSLVVKANPAIGIASDVTEVAPSGTNWVTIGPASITPLSAGATWVELRANLDRQLHAVPCYFDSITRA